MPHIVTYRVQHPIVTFVVITIPPIVMPVLVHIYSILVTKLAIYPLLLFAEMESLEEKRLVMMGIYIIGMDVILLAKSKPIIIVMINNSFLVKNIHNTAPILER